jgi:uridine phosphorylase
VISTGIGTDNIDIVFNEIDALFNLDFNERKVLKNLTSLNFIRIGTSGCLQKDIPLDSFLFTEFSVGMDNLFSFYDSVSDQNTINIQTNFQDFCARSGTPRYPTVWFKGNDRLMDMLRKDNDFKGITLTCPGFYGPQGRELRLNSKLSPFLDALSHFRSADHRFTNFEMETSGIYGMSHLLGHKAISCNALLANRLNGTFSTTPTATVERLIIQVLEGLVENETIGTE